MSSLEWVPIEIQNRPYVPAFINGQGVFSLLFDTGSVGCDLSREVAQALHLSVEEGVTTLRTLAIGNRQWQDLRFGVSDHTSVQALLNRPVDGFLGTALLHAVLPAGVLTIDYPACRLLLDDLGESLAGQVDPPPVSVPLTLKSYYALVPVWLNGRGPFQFFLDTGASQCIVSPQVADTLGLVRGKAVPAKGVVDVKDAHTAAVETISVGAAYCRDMQVLVMDCAQVSDTTYAAV